MSRANKSLARQLQLSFALMAFVVIGSFAVIMNVMLERTLEREDALVMEAQAGYLLRVLQEGQEPSEEGMPRPEKSEWQVLQGDRVFKGSHGMARIPDLPWERVLLDGAPLEWERESSTYSMLRRRTSTGELRMVMDRSHEGQLLSAFRRTLWLASLAATAVAALLSWVVSRRGLRPLSNIAERTAAVRPGGTFDPLNPDDFPAELGQLVSVLNSAFARLQEAIQRLDQMASEVAHELRTPLQHIRSSVESLALKQQPVSPEHLGGVLEACEGLQSLVDSMLLLAQTEDPRSVFTMRSVDVSALLQDTYDFFEGLAEEQQVSIQVEAPVGIECLGHGTLLRRAVHNLMANALRATPLGGSIWLRAGQDGHGVFLDVEDGGTGFSEDVLQRLGSRWVRGPGSVGHGLGLAIVMGIARMHQGRIDILRSPRGGALVRLHLPSRPV